MVCYCCVVATRDRLNERHRLVKMNSMKERYGEIAKQILGIVGVTGVVIVAAAVPGVLLVAKIFEQNHRQFPKKYEKQKAARTIQRLQETNLLKITKRGGELIVELTEEGKKKLKEIELTKIMISKPSHWDRKWRIVVFDIPDRSFKQARDALRGKLRQWEFYPLQKSVWVCPWPCEKEIQLIAELYGVNRYVNVILSEKILYDAAVRKHFAL